MKARQPPRALATPSVCTPNLPVQPKSIRARDVAALLIVAVLWALCYPLITLGLAFTPPLSFAALRALAAGSALALAAGLLRRPVPHFLPTWAALAGIGLGTTSLGFLGMFHASEYVSPGLATVIANGQPLLAAILAYFFLRERLSLMQRLGLLLGFLGIVAISLPHFGGPARAGFVVGIAYIALAASGVSVGNILMKALGDQVDPLVAVAAQKEEDKPRGARTWLAIADSLYEAMSLIPDGYCPKQAGIRAGEVSGPGRVIGWLGPAVAYRF